MSVGKVERNKERLRPRLEEAPEVDTKKAADTEEAIPGADKAAPEKEADAQPAALTKRDPSARRTLEEQRRQDSALVMQRARLDSAVGATNLRTEVLDDGEENCLEHAVEMARPGKDELVFLNDRRTEADGDENGAGHVLVRDPASSRVWDPNDGPAPANPQAWPHRNTEAWIASQGSAADGGPAYSVDATVPANRVQDVLSLQGDERAAAIDADPQLAAIADNLYADAPTAPDAVAADGVRTAVTPVRLTDDIPVEERPDFTRIDAWAEANGPVFETSEVLTALRGQSELGELTDAERTRVMDHATESWRGSSEAYRDPPTDHRAIRTLAHEVRNEPELRRFVGNDYAHRAAALANQNGAGDGVVNPRVTRQAAAFASNAGAAMASGPLSDHRAVIDNLGERAPAFAAAFSLGDDYITGAGSFRYGGADGIDFRAAHAGRFLEAAAVGEPTEGSRAFVNAAFATSSDRTFEVNNRLPGQMASALATQWHHGDPEARIRETNRFTEVLGTRQGRDFLFGGEHTLATRAENMALVRANPEWDAEIFQQTDSAFENPNIMLERARPRARDFDANRGDEPVVMRGSDLDNTVGFAMGFPPQGVPENETPEQREARETAAARGEHSYYEGEPASEIVGPVVDQIRNIGGPDAEVTVLPIQFSSDQTGVVDLALFRVQDQTTGEDRFVDNLGRRYNSFEAWRENNQLPPGNVTYPYDGHLSPGSAGGPRLRSGNTPNTVDTWQERAGQVVDTAALVGGIVATGAVIVGTGGTAALVVAGGAGAWGAYRSGERLADRAEHGQSINPFTDSGARSEWLAFGANALGVAGIGATAGALRLARSGSALSPAAATAASYLNVGGAALDGLAAGDAGYTLATQWDELSGGQRAQLALSMGFWGVSTARGAAQSGGRVRDMFNPNVQRQHILQSDPILRGTADANAQARRLGSAEPDLVAQVRLRARGLEGEAATRFNADLERALLEAPPGSTNGVLRLYGDLDPSAARRGVDGINSLPTVAARQEAYQTVLDGAEGLQRTVTDPAERAAMLEGLTRMAGNPRITGLNDWVRFSTDARTATPETTQNLRDDFGELLVAETMAGDLRPGQTIRVGNDANAGVRPGTDDTLPSFDLVIEGPGGPINIDVYSPQGRPDPSAFSQAINHAAGKRITDPTLPADLRTTGTVEAAVRLRWPPPDNPVNAGTVVTAANGDVTLMTNNGQRISRGNVFTDYLDQLNGVRGRSPAGANDVNGLTVFGQDGTPLYQYTRGADGQWTGQAR